MVDSHGQIISELTPYTTSSLTADLRLYEGVTPAGRVGLGVEYLALAISLVAILRRLYRR